MQICYINYLLHFGSIKIHEHIGRYLVLTSREKFFQQFSAFLAIFFGQ